MAGKTKVHDVMIFMPSQHGDESPHRNKPSRSLSRRPDQQNWARILYIHTCIIQTHKNSEQGSQVEESASTGGEIRSVRRWNDCARKYMRRAGMRMY